MAKRGLTLFLDSRLEQLSLLAVAVRAVCHETPLADDTIDRVELALVEAVTNVIKHGYAGAPDQPITVRVELFDDRLVLTIEDQGTPIPPELLEAVAASGPPAPTLDPSTWPESGMGLGLIAAAADALAYAPSAGTNRLGLEWRYPPDGAA